MPELTPNQDAALHTIIEGLGPAISNAISENIGRLVLVDDPTVEEKSLNALMSDADTLLQTNWTFPALGADELMMILSGIDALELAAVVVGAVAPEAELTDASLASLSPAMQGIAQGIGIALGNATNRPIQAFNIACSAAPISVGAAFVTAGAAIAIRIPFHVQDGPDGAFTLYMTPATASSLADGAGEMPVAESNDTEGDLDINAMASSFFGGAEGGAGLGGEAAPGAPLGGPAFGGGPLAGGPLMAPASPFQAFDAIGGGPDGVSRSMDLIMDIPLDVSVELGRVQMLIKDVLELATGSIVELERVAGEPVDLLVNGQLIAKGEVVVIEDNFGIRITEIVSPADRLHGMSKRAA